MLVCNFKVLFIGHFLYNQFLSVAAAAYCVWNVHGHLIPLLKQELLEVADEGLHCLAWQSYKTPSYEREDCSVHSIQAVDIKRTGGTIGSFKSNVTTNDSAGVETIPIEKAHDNFEDLGNTKLKDFCEAADENVFLDSEVGDNRVGVEHEHLLQLDIHSLQPGDQDDSSHKFFKFQSLDVKESDENEKFFIVQPLEYKCKDQDQVIDLMKNQGLNHALRNTEFPNYTSYEDFSDIEIEDLEAEKENISRNMTEAETFKITAPWHIRFNAEKLTIRNS
uniref:Uncharacterized protein n=1 Tax=Physcomitrium patens TaxID=3218 RepID=A0A2K1JCQ5_PHYPA|nr:hypothetical protein PHYPA_019594 [Physcomitrium patens]